MPRPQRIPALEYRLRPTAYSLSTGTPVIMNAMSAEGPSVLTITLNAAIDVTLTIPTLEAGASYTARDTLKLPGGKGNNVARSLRRLGATVRAAGLAGGPPGDFIVSGLTNEGIDAQFMPILGESRTCTAIVELDRHRATEVNEPGPTITPAEEKEFLEFFSTLASDSTAVALCGSLPVGLPPDYYGAITGLARAADVPVVLDTSGPALGPGIEASPLVVKINAREATQLTQAEVHDASAAVQAAQLLRDRGAYMAIVTLGAAGAVLVHEAGAWWAHSDIVRPLSTVGSGDAFTAGFIAAVMWAVADGESPTFEAAARRDDVAVRGLILGTACGSANAITLGAGRIDPDAVERFRRAVTVVTL